MKIRKAALVAAVLGVTAGWSSNAFAIRSTNTSPSWPTTVNLNQFLGCNTWYTAGYTGSTAIVANIEAGLAWGNRGGAATTSHETLGLNNVRTGQQTITQYFADTS